MAIGRYGCCRWLRYGYQHDGNSRSMAILAIGLHLQLLVTTLIALGTIGVAIALIYLNLLKGGMVVEDLPSN